MKISPVFPPIFEHHQKLIFDAQRVGLAAGCLLLPLGGAKQRRHLFKCAPPDTRKPPECFAFQLFDRIKSHRRPLLAATNQLLVKKGLCKRSIFVTPRFAPLGCAANIVIDRAKLKQTGAVTLSFTKDGAAQMRAARAADEDRPWSPAPKRGWGRGVPLAAAAKDGQDRTTSEEPEPGEGADASSLE